MVTFSYNVTRSYYYVIHRYIPMVTFSYNSAVATMPEKISENRAKGLDNLIYYLLDY